MKKQYVLLLAVLLAGLLAGCGSKDTTITGTEKDSVLAFSETKTDNLLAGMNANDYAAFSKDFDDEMLKAMPQSQFEVVKKDLDSKIGLYRSRQVNRVIKSGDYYNVFYDAKFEKADAITIQVVFQVAEPHQISGLWFK